MAVERVMVFANKALAHMPPAPACFTPKQWGEWSRIAKRTGLPLLSGYCADCTPAYQAKMTEAGRCGYPDAVFVTDEDGMTKGVRRKAKRVGGVAQKMKGPHEQR